MLDASVVEEYRLGVASDIRHFFVVEPCNSGTREPAADRWLLACSSGACSGSAVAWDGLVEEEGVVG